MRFPHLLSISTLLALTAACGGGKSSATGGAGGEGTGASSSASSTSSSSSGSGASSSSSSGSGSSSSGAAAGGLFQAQEPWNTAVDQDPVDPASAAVIGWLEQHGGWGTGEMRIDYTITLQHADASTPRAPFVPSGDFYTPDCDMLPGGFPLPPGGAVEGEDGYACVSDGDCHLLVVDDEAHKLYEMFRAFAPPSSTTFNGGCAVVWDLLKAYPPNLRGDNCGSVDAGGFPVSALLFTADEVAAGHVDHAIRFILPNSRIRGGDVYVHPATHATGATTGGADAPPYGVRFRLKPSFDLAKLPSDGARVVARALQKYGMFLADGGNIALTGADDRFTTAKWSDPAVDMDSFALSSIQVSDFEVVNMGATIPWSGDCVRNP